MAEPRAIGVFECRGMTTLAAALDAMTKASSVRLSGRHGIGSGWLTIVIEGTTADVQTAMGAAHNAANDHGDVITAVVLPRPEVAALHPMPHTRSLSLPETPAGEAIGWLETKGLTTLAVGVDRMLKAADVELLGWTFIGGALVHACITGSIADVETAIAAGGEAASRQGELFSQLVIEQPESDVLHLLPPAVTGSRRPLGALGIVETTGYVGAVHSADRMVKEAAVDIIRLSIGSGGRVATLAAGALDDVKAAVNEASSVLEPVAQHNGEALITNPDPQLVAAFAEPAPVSPHTSKPEQALGLLETRTTVGLVSAVDAMLKSSQVTYEGRHKVGYYLTAAVIRGELGAVDNALDVGARTAQRHGELVGRHVVALPYAELTDRLSHT